MKENEKKTNIKKWCVTGVLLLCIFAIIVIAIILSNKNQKGNDVMAIYVQEQGSDYIYTSQDDGLSWADGNVPAFFMTAQEKEIRRDGEEITVTIKNNSDEIVLYGEPYHFYKWSKNTWVPYNEMKPTEYDLVFNDRAYLLQPNDFCDLKCNLQYYDFKRGKYLLKKSVNWEKDNSWWDLSVEFVIN